MEYVITIIISVITSAIASNAIAAYHFNMIDGYIKSMVELVKSYIDKVSHAADKLK